MNEDHAFREIPDESKEKYTATGPEMGDVDAPTSTRMWAAGIRTKLQVGLKEIRTEAHHLDFWASLTRDKEIYRLLDDGNGKFFTSYEDFCCCPYPWGLGYEKTDIERIIIERKQTQAADIAANAVPLMEHGTNQHKMGGHSNGMSSKTHVSTSSYVASRLKRERPDLIEKVASGEIKSMRAAAIQAGFVKKSVQLPADPKGIARGLKRHLTELEVAYLIALLS